MTDETQDKPQVEASVNGEAVEVELLDGTVVPRVQFPKLGESRRKDYSAQKFVKDVEISQKVRELARSGVSKRATALLCDLSYAQLTKYYLEDYDAGQGMMEHIVAAAAMEQVMAGNPQMIMFVAKTKLGWSEHNVIEHTGTVNAVVSAKPLSKEEFERKYLSNDSEDSETA